jgi:MerR family mercuric resistance operon transcriptional regulator
VSAKRNESMLHIGQISKQTGVGIDAIRFYERSGLIAAPPRSEGGFRLYSSSDLSTLQFIRSLQALGFSLNEIRDFLSLRGNDLRACSEVRKMLDHKLRDIHAKRIALSKLEAELKDAVTKCNSQLRRSRAKQNNGCPVLTAYKGSKHEGAA